MPGTRVVAKLGRVFSRGIESSFPWAGRCLLVIRRDVPGELQSFCRVIAVKSASCFCSPCGEARSAAWKLVVRGSLFPSGWRKPAAQPRTP